MGKNKNDLTEREKEIVRELINKGRSNKVLSADLGMAESTLETHMKSIHQKTNTKSKAELIIWGMKNPDKIT